jgi:hypothetical protein
MLPKKRKTMKKIIILLLMCLSLAAVGQKVHKTNVIASLAMNGVRLVNIDSTYSIQVRTDNRYEPYVTVLLGDSADAVRYLEFLSELHVEGEDVVELENPTKNYITRGAFGSFLVHDETRTFRGNMHRTHARSMWEALTGEKYKKRKKEK